MPAELRRFTEREVKPVGSGQRMFACFERQHAVITQPRRPAPHHNIAMQQRHALGFIAALQAAKLEKQ